MKIRKLSIIILISLSFMAQNSKSELISQAKIFFKNYQTLENNFDKKFIDLYSDDAIIIIHSDNILDEKRKLEITGKDYKELLISTLDYDKNSGNYNKYTKVKFTIQKNNRVKITGNSFSVLKKFHSPFVLILKLDEKNNFTIFYKETYSK